MLFLPFRYGGQLHPRKEKSCRDLDKLGVTLILQNRQAEHAASAGSPPMSKVWPWDLLVIVTNNKIYPS